MQEGVWHTPPGKFQLRDSPCVLRQSICPEPEPLLWAPPLESRYHIVRVCRLLGSLWNETWLAGTRASKELLLGFPSSLEQIISKITEENFLIVIQVEGATNKSSASHSFVGHKTLRQYHVCPITMMTISPADSQLSPLTTLDSLYGLAGWSPVSTTPSLQGWLINPYSSSNSSAQGDFFVQSVWSCSAS